MKVIFKYPFKIADIVDILLPFGSRVIAIQEQRGIAFLWAIVNPEEKSLGNRRFYVFGTGNEITAPIHEMKHISTVQVNGFVWHIFE